MAYALYTQSFGASNALAEVFINEAGTGLPAVILATATGGVVNSRGIARLDSSGNLSVYIDTARTWEFRVSDGDTKVPVQGAVPGDGNPLAAARPTRLYALGDSIVADCYAGGIWTGHGWLAWARRYLGHRVDMPASRMLAVGGATVGIAGFQNASNNVLTQQLPMVAAGAADMAIVGVGINSLGATTTATLISEYTQIFDGLRAKGLGVIIIPIRVKGSGAPITGDNLFQASQLNQWFRTYARSSAGGVSVWDPNPLYINFATGLAQASFLRDDLHDTQAGAHMMGKAFADWLGPQLLAQDDAFCWLGDVYDAIKNPGGNLLTNGLLTGTGGTTINGATGSTPTSWRGARSSGAATHTATFAVTTDATYSTLPRATITLGGTGDSNSAFLDQYIDRTATISPGDLVYCEALVDWSIATAGFRAIGLSCIVADTGFATLASAWDGYANNETYGYLGVGAGAALLRTEPIVVPAGMRYVAPQLYVYPNPTGTPNAVIGVKRMAMRKVVR